ncbi:hypothetical protein EWM64_g119 [Hericium alpestre]|uniref:NADP-dependent oxidoreductase domain-containing protein n=1 Tax=Hericium alpestre TaxID=135208 RepID=A0A4Z0AD96_9AGAM|nr:hypothetical protein EWM64_g119 [Hericium alpestre]
MLETSVKALHPHEIRTLYLHAPDRSVPFEDTLRAINDFYKEGKLSVTTYLRHMLRISD